MEMAIPSRTCKYFVVHLARAGHRPVCNLDGSFARDNANLGAKSKSLGGRALACSYCDRMLPL
jgi:hypothetical protein